MKYRVGCSGWSYKHWRNEFYPRELPAARWLQHYASVLDTVELNATFYRLPTVSAVKSWRDTVQDDFRFSAKVSRLITHFRRLRNCEEALSRYLGRIRLLGDKLGPLLYQLPPDFERDDARLGAFLKLLPADITHVFEFRHESWWTDEVFELLREHGASFCAFDMGRTQTPIIATSADFYMRFHGPEEAYRSGYSDAALKKAARQIEALEGVKTAWIYFNNDVGGHAPRDAQRLKELQAG